MRGEVKKANAFSRCLRIRALLTKLTDEAASARPSTEAHQKSGPPAEKGSGAPRGALSNQCPRQARPRTSPLFLPLCGGRTGRGRVAFRRSRVRHSPPAATPMAQLQNRVSRRLRPAGVLPVVPDVATVKHAPCGPVLMPVDRGPGAARERIGIFRPRAPHLASLLRHAVRNGALGERDSQSSNRNSDECQ